MDAADVSIIIVAIAVGAFVKGVTGSGLPQVAIPVMAIFLGVEHAVVVMAVPGIVSNTWLLWRYRHHLPETRDLPVLLATGTLGAIGGTWLLKELDPRILSGVLASVILGYVLLRTARPSFALSAGVTQRLSAPVGLAAGTLQGATGISGPLLTTYIHGYRYPPRVYVVALVTMFQVFSVVQTATLVGLGLFTTERFSQGMLTLVPMAIALHLGTLATSRMSARAFDRWVLALLVASAAKLAHGAIWG
jgi:uncharacterized protein